MTSDDELISALSRAMTACTADDAPSASLVQTLVRLPVPSPRRPYLVPVGAAAVVTALTAGGVVLASLPVGSTVPAAGESVSPAASVAVTTSAQPSPQAAASVAPSVVAATTAVNAAPTPGAVAAPTTTATTTTAPTTTATTTSASPTPAGATVTATATGPTTPTYLTVVAPMDGSDDAALLAHAASWSVTSVTVTDTAHPGVKTAPHVDTYQHNDSKAFYADQAEISWDQLAQLPTATEAFRAAVKEPGHPPNAVEKGLQELIGAPLSLAQRKAYLAVAESMPGAVVTSDTVDQIGRSATRVRIETDLILDDYYFDPVSYRLLESGSTWTPEWVAHYKATQPTGTPDVSTFGTGYYISYSNWSYATPANASAATTTPTPAS
jgi:hypothetical protein